MAHVRLLSARTRLAAGWPTTQSLSAATISLGVGMSLTPQFMLAWLPLKFCPPNCVWPDTTDGCSPTLADGPECV